MGQFLNPGFETVDGSNLPTGWTILNERFTAGQTFIIGGSTFTSPLDPTYPTNNASRNLADDDAASLSYTSTTSTTNKTEGTRALELTSSGSSVSYGVVRGPWVYSSEFAVTAGQALSFDWKAEGGGDAFDVFGFLVNTTTGGTQIVLNETGGFAKSDGSGTWAAATNWNSTSVTVADSGDYRFVFLSGTFDESGGTALGAKLFLDNFGGAAVFGDVQYSANTFSEASANDGTITNTITATLNSNANFAAGPFTSATHYTITNVPAGLTAAVTRTGDKTITIQLTGTATAHANADDVSNISFSLLNAALSGGATVASIGGATNTKLHIDYTDTGNRAPTGLGDLTLSSALEDTTPTGTAISTLTGLSFQDVDAGSSLGGVVIVGNTAPSTTGVWQYSTNGGTNWNSIGSVSSTTALALSAATLVRFLPAANYSGTPTPLTFRVLDNTAGIYSTTGASASRVLIDASYNGGGTPIAATTNVTTTTITAVNDAAILTSSGTTAYGVNAGATAVNSALTLTDDSASLASATISITTNFQTSQDVLAFTNDGASMGDIAGSYDATTGVLSLTTASTPTMAEWQAALRAVTYNNTSVTPNTTSRTVSFIVNDGALNSTAVTRTVSITNAPAIAGLNGDAPSGTPGSTIKLDTGTAATVTDLDSANFNTGTLTYWCGHRHCIHWWSWQRHIQRC